MNSIAAIEVPESCKSLVGLVKRQQKICKRNIETMESVRYGALIAIDECQHQFRNRRWNCSTVDPVKLFGNVLKAGELDTHGVQSRMISVDIFFRVFFRLLFFVLLLL